MNSTSRRVRYAALAVLYAVIACNSTSPLENEPLDLAARGGNGGGNGGKSGGGGSGGGKSALKAAPLDVSFGSTGTTASVTLTNSSRKTLSWTASENAGWLSLGATSGSIAARSSKTVSMSVQRGSLAAGSYSTDVTFASSAGSAVVSASMTVAAPVEQFDVNPLQVDFGNSATSASVTLKNNTSGPLSWSASESSGWLSLGATSGSIAANSSQTLSLSAQRSGMTAGTYTTSLRVSGGTAGADTAAVSMTVPSASSVSLAGQLVHQFSGQGLAGLTVQYDGVTTTTDGSGRFSILGDATSSLQQLTISGSGVYKRQTFARTGDNLWRVVPSGFSMTAYNDVARDEFGPGTVRWVAAPTVYIDSRPEGFTSSELSTWIAEVKAQVPTFIQKWTGTQMNPAAVIVTSSPPSDFTAGTIVIHFSENSNDYGGSSNTIGYARLSYSSSGAIHSSAVWLRYVRYSGTSGASKRKGILGHELGHATGLGHMSGTTASFMQPSIGTNTDLSAFDVQAASFHYTRSPKNTTPDTDSSASFLGMLAPSGLPAVKEWVCDAGEAAGAR